jgi:tRNA (adenine37-N6)-methyltransferase
MKIEFSPIGIIHSPFTEPQGMPIQPTGAAGIKGTVEVFKAFQTGLKDLDGFSHIILLYHFHRSRGFDLSVVPFMDTVPRGLFATRAPKRPNAIGLSIVRLEQVEGGVLTISNVDIIDGTPLLDIKPYAPEFDAQQGVRTGWLEKAGKSVSAKRSDERFK